jgi:hypothetical protein
MSTDISPIAPIHDADEIVVLSTRTAASPWRSSRVCDQVATSPMNS